MTMTKDNNFILEMNEIISRFNIQDEDQRQDLYLLCLEYNNDEEKVKNEMANIYHQKMSIKALYSDIIEAFGDIDPRKTMIFELYILGYDIYQISIYLMDDGIYCTPTIAKQVIEDMVNKLIRTRHEGWRVYLK